MSIINPVELRRRGMEVLVRELGFHDAMRFMLQFSTGEPGRDYTRDRQEILPDWTIDQLLDEARKMGRDNGRR